jgi:ribose-phosphate pyrophosphokinase
MPGVTGEPVMTGPRILTGTSHPDLGRAVAAALRTEPDHCLVDQFPDGELRPAVEGVRGADVYLVQPTGPPVSEHVVELLLLLDACRRAGADRVTAVVPYLGYARQDRRGRAGEAIGARVMAEAITAAGADRLIVVDPHTTAVEAMFDIPVEVLTAVLPLHAALAADAPAEPVVVAPDLGAVRLAEYHAARMAAPVAVVRKHRLTGATVRAEEIVGPAAGRRPVIVDDMISTAGTIAAAVRVLLAHDAHPDVVVAACHGLFVGSAVDRLACLPLRRVLVTDSVTPTTATATAELPIRVCSIAGLLADAIGRLHRDEPLDDLLFPQ